MYASTNVCTALALSPVFPSPVARVSDTPPTDKVELALTVTVPADAELNVIVH